MNKLFLLLSFVMSGCYLGVDSGPRHYHTAHQPTKAVYYEPSEVHVEVVYYEEDNYYYEFYNEFGEWCYGEYDFDSPNCFVEWCYDHIDDWWYEWGHYCQSEPYYDEYF